MEDIAEETAALGRLAEAHRTWRDNRPPPPPAAPVSDDEARASIAEIWRKVKNPKPQDVEAVRDAAADPLGTVILSQLTVVGWRLYAKGGVQLLTSVCSRIEVEQHPGFVYAVRRAWTGLGFPGDPRGSWGGTEML